MCTISSDLLYLFQPNIVRLSQGVDVCVSVLLLHSLLNLLSTHNSSLLLFFFYHSLYVMAAGSKNAKKRKANNSDPDISSDSDIVFDDLSSEGQAIYQLINKRFTPLCDSLSKKLSVKDARIDKLEQEVSYLRKYILSLEEKIDDSEAYERRDTVILSGSSVPVASDSENCSDLICDLVRDKVRVNLKSSDISVAHRLGRKPTTQAQDRRSLIVKFCRRDLKYDLLKAARTVKPDNFYINESLTPTRNTAMFGLRQAKKKFPHIIAGYGSMDGKVYCFVKPPNPTSPMARNMKTFVNTRKRFDELCVKTLGCESKDLVNNWPSN